MNIFDLDPWIGAEAFAELADENIHAACIEVVIISPEFLECRFTGEKVIFVAKKKLKQIRFFGRQLEDFTLMFNLM